MSESSGFSLDKSVVCSDSPNSRPTVMKLHGSDNRGGTAVKTCIKITCSHMKAMKKNTCLNFPAKEILFVVFSLNTYVYAARNVKIESADPACYT